MSDKNLQEQAMEYLFQRIGMVSKYKRMPKPKVCEVCNKYVDNYEWHYKLSHTNFKEEKRKEYEEYKKRAIKSE